MKQVAVMCHAAIGIQDYILIIKTAIAFCNEKRSTCENYKWEHHELMKFNFLGLIFN